MVGRLIRCGRCGAIFVASADAAVLLPQDSSGKTPESEPGATDAESAVPRIDPGEVMVVPRASGGPLSRPEPVAIEPPTASRRDAPDADPPTAMPRESPWPRKRRVPALNAPAESLTSLLVLLYPIAQVIIGLFLYRTDPERLREFSTGGPMETVAAFAITNVLQLLLVIGPAAMIGLFLAGLLMRFRLPPGAYMKMCGVAAVPAIMLAATVLAPARLGLQLTLLAAGVPCALYILYNAFGLDARKAPLATVLVGLFYTVGQIGAPMLAGTLIALFTLSDRLPHRLAVTLPQPVVPQTQAGSATPPAQAAVPAELGLEAPAAALTFEKPDADVFEPIAATESWDLADPLDPSLGSEVGFLTWRLRPARSLQFDVRAYAQNESAPAWIIARGPAAGRLCVSAVPRGNMRQTRPWVIRRGYPRQAAQLQKLMTVMTDSPAVVTYGKINGHEFTRIAWRGSDGSAASQRVQYVASEGSRWLAIDIECSDGDEAAMASLEMSAKSIRAVMKGESQTEPYTAESVVDALGEDEAAAARLLVRLGSRAEDAVLVYLKAAGTAERAKALRVLERIATQKSVADLRRLAGERTTEAAALARALLKKLSPTEYDDVGEAMADLQGTDREGRRAALTLLAGAKADQRREAVALVLENIATSGQDEQLADEVASALAVWASGKTVDKLLPLLGESGNGARRHVAMKVLARLKDPRASQAIVRWLSVDTQVASEALIVIGPAAEPAVIEAMSETGTTMRQAGVDILRQIGTARCLQTLTLASADQLDPALARSARDAIQVVRQRLTERPRATQPAGTQP